MHLDFSQLRMSDLKLHTNMSEGEVILPTEIGHTRARIRASMSEVKVYIPEGLRARINAPNRLAGLIVAEDRFPRRGGVFQSLDYESAEHKVDLEVQSELGTLQIL